MIPSSFERRKNSKFRERSNLTKILKMMTDFELE